jgi:hypothetical protein
MAKNRTKKVLQNNIFYIEVNIIGLKKLGSLTKLFLLNKMYTFISMMPKIYLTLKCLLKYYKKSVSIYMYLSATRNIKL